MRKLILAILFLALSVPASAEDRLAWGGSMMMVGGGAAAAEGGGYTEELFYNVDHASGDNVAVKTHRTAEVVGTAYALDFVVTSSDPGTSSSDGGKAVKVSQAWSSRIVFPVDSDMFGSTQGLVSFEYYHTDQVGLNEVLRFWNVTDSARIFVSTLAANTVNLLIHDGVTTRVNFTSTNTFLDATWTTIQVRWNAATDTAGIKIGGAAWEDTAATDLGVWTTEPTSMSINNDSGGSASRPWYLDALKIWKTYDGT